MLKFEQITAQNVRKTRFTFKFLVADFATLTYGTPSCSIPGYHPDAACFFFEILVCDVYNHHHFFMAPYSMFRRLPSLVSSHV